MIYFYVNLTFIGKDKIDLFFRIVLSSVICAIKYNEDDYYSNSYYAKVGGIQTKEVNTLEFEFVQMLKYNLFIKEDLFEKYKIYLAHYKIKKQKL